MATAEAKTTSDAPQPPPLANARSGVNQPAATSKNATRRATTKVYHRKPQPAELHNMQEPIYCKICNQWLNGPDQHQRHQISRKHNRRMKTNSNSQSSRQRQHCLQLPRQHRLNLLTQRRPTPNSQVIMMRAPLPILAMDQALPLLLQISLCSKSLQSIASTARCGSMAQHNGKTTRPERSIGRTCHGIHGLPACSKL